MNACVPARVSEQDQRCAVYTEKGISVAEQAKTLLEDHSDVCDETVLPRRETATADQIHTSKTKSVHQKREPHLGLNPCDSINYATYL